LGADGVELDVHDTADGELLVHHDPRLGNQPIRRMTAEAARAHRLTNGEPVPTLRDALAAVGETATAFVEVKSLDPAHDGVLLALLGTAAWSARAHVHGFDHRIVRRLKTRRPGLVTGVLSTSYPVDPFHQLAGAGASELWQHESLIDEPLVRGAHERGAAVIAWTVDDPARMRELLALGVDGICTNRPDVAREAVG
jgi:glycerophosphoryl diester phosphodiesterase